MFLQDHYVSNTSSAWALTSYLEDIDGTQRSRSRAAAPRPSPAAARMSESPIRPPASIPGR
jgi:hypothetical protein